MHTLRGHPVAATDVRFSDDGAHVLSGDGGTVRVWVPGTVRARIS